MATKQLYIDGYLMGNVLGSSGGQSSGGHTIVNASNTDMQQRAKMQFVDAGVTDDSANNKTKVEVVQLIDDESELTNAPDGVYQGDYDDIPEDVLDASMVAYGNGSVEDALDGLQVYCKQHSIAGVSLNQSENGWHYGVVENVVPQGYEIISVGFGVAYSCGVVATAIGGVHVMLQSKEISTIPSNRYLRVCYTKVTSV